jgi:hypothetical protein
MPPTAKKAAEETKPAAKAEETKPAAEKKPDWMCPVPGCTERRALGVCSGHAIHYYADGRRRP